MPNYRVVGNLTYSSTANRNTALSAMNNVVANYNLINTATGSITGGITSVSTVQITVSLICPTEAVAEQFRIQFLPAWTAAARTSGFLAIVREP